MKIVKSKKFILAMLLLVFLSPGILAYVFFMHPQWLSGPLVNKGQLLKTPVLIESLANAHQWHLMLWQSQGCDRACDNTMEKLARIRLALGRRFYDLSVVLLQPENTTLSEATLTRFKDMKIDSLAVNPLQYDLKDLLYIANPQGYVILSYPLTVDSKDIYDDIKHLMRVGES